MKIACLGDVHAPWGHAKAIAWAISRVREFKPDYVVQVGDAFDMFAHSKFPKVVKLPVEEELTQGKQQLEALWSGIRKVAPNSRRFQLCGNHDDRPLKRATAAAPELVPLVGKSLRELFSFAGVTTIHDPKEELFIRDICFQHGHYAHLGDHAKFNQLNTVHGHTHRGGTWFGRNRNGPLWELDCGLLGDPDQECFSYRSQRRIHTCTVGLGLVTDSGPVFEPYPGR